VQLSRPDHAPGSYRSQTKGSGSFKGVCGVVFTGKMSCTRVLGGGRTGEKKKFLGQSGGSLERVVTLPRLGCSSGCSALVKDTQSRLTHAGFWASDQQGALIQLGLAHASQTGSMCRSEVCLALQRCQAYLLFCVPPFLALQRL
jgi:hypothetical protein